MDDNRPIIVVKKVKGHGGHHGGSWKVAYADFVTAMMAFFLVMWILGLNQDTRKAIAAYFNDPVGMMKSQAGGTNPMNVGRESQRGKVTLLPPTTSILNGSETRRFRTAKKALEKMIRESPEFRGFRKHVEIRLTEEGLRIELLEDSESMFFETGSAQIKSQTQKLLQRIGEELKTMPNPVILEGHTDSRPYSGGQAGYSNWELSSDRANSARRAMVSSLRPHQVTEVRGYADRYLRNPLDPMHFSNRRISILVGYSDQKRPTRTEELGLNRPIGPIQPAPINIRMQIGKGATPNPGLHASGHRE